MYYFTILAQAFEIATEAPEAAEGLVPIDFIWEQIIALNLVEALTFICFGVVCLLYGWRIFKVLATISFALFGLFAGVQINKLLVGGNEIWLGIIFMAIFAFVSVPLIRWAVCILGALAGGILTGGIWFACNLPEQYIWAGALIGLIAGGMISFIIFGIAVMLFSSLGGSTLMLMGILALLYTYPQTTEQVEELVLTKSWFLPAALLVPTAAGIFLQNKFAKGAKDWRA
jgi:hypothetical protein